jgi:lipoprotein-anchoring transpeptidase ErfK/SrfK
MQAVTLTLNFFSNKSIRRPSIIAALIATAISFSVSSCVTRPKVAELEKPKGIRLYEWRGDGVKGPPSIVINLSEQKARFYRAGEEVGWTYVASGKSSHPTPTGNFRIMEKVEDKISNLYGTLKDANGDVVNSDFNLSKDNLPEGMQFEPARMPLYMRLAGDGVGMHVGKIPKPGATASHGCIRLPRHMAEKFFANTAVGTPVTIISGK